VPADLPEITIEVTFLAPDDGGRDRLIDLPPSATSFYRPHLVVGDPGQRKAIVRDGVVITEEYLGVQFMPGSGRFEFGVPRETSVQLLYDVSLYERLVPGETFTVREGGQIVGFGRVLP